MAGIGFELNRILKKDNYMSLIGAYSYAGIITSGPWILAVLTILILSIVAKSYGIHQDITSSFQVIIVYCIAGSLILSSVFQHSYTRYIADQFYLQRQDQIVPSLNCIYTLMLMLSGLSGYLLVYYLLPNEPQEIKLLVISCFIVLCLIWVTTSVMSGLLAYKTIFFAFFSNFLLSILLGYCLRSYGLRGLLGSFISGQFLLLMILIYIIYKYYPSGELINYNFFRKHNLKISLLFTGIFYNIGIWVDKFIFWYHSSTGMTLIGHLRQSLVYDTPIFLAYLAVIPGTIIFLMHMETDYAMAHKNLFKKINGNNTLHEIQFAYRKLLLAGRTAILSVIKSQAYLFMVAVTVGSAVFAWLNISTAYFPLFCICLLGASLNVVFWSALDIIFYLDKVPQAVFLTGFFVLSNILFSWLSIELGIFYFGFGLVTSLLLTVILSFLILNHEISQLLYRTYVFAAGVQE